ncbi:N-acetyltransferase [Lactococcus petauri]|uniref:N-acetyltransferase n=1 Tax=Lactococcus petauri TaxID=1940789 RepID=UPI0022E271B0|nr:N-acetyltransferase [Lactococcus petauri]
MIRKMKAEDLQKVVELWLRVNIANHRFIKCEYWLKQAAAVEEAMKDADIYVYEENQKIIAFVGLIDQYIAGIFVSNSKQSKGIGKSLLQHIKASSQTLSLKVYQKNEGALRFYQREGFKIVAEGLDEDNNEKEFLMTWN